HAEKLSSDEDETIREHLVHCDECAALVLELAALSESSAEPASEVSAFEVAAACRRQRPRLLEELGSGTAKAPSARWAWATAASLALATMALGLWVATLRQTVEELREPQVNPPVLNLEPVGAVRDPANAVPVMELVPGASRGWLILNPAEDPGCSSYRVEFIASDGRSLWTRAGFERSEAGNFRLELPRALLPAGEYRVLLSGLRDGRQEPIDEYRLRISYP
ncbi:MAG: hypothetical protein GY856_37440, partial [bacterium]|nr:hypothetical protein [bacterium]